MKAIRTQLRFLDSLVSVFIATQILDRVVDEIQDTSNDHRSINDDALWKSHTERILALLTRDDPTPLDADARENIHKAIQELRRAEGEELHNIASLAGGLVAQESLKVITKQYGPLDNTCVFDGARSRSEMYRL